MTLRALRCNATDCKQCVWCCRECPGWQSTQECIMNPSFMRAKCPATCRICPGVTIPLTSCYACSYLRRPCTYDRHVFGSVRNHKGMRVVSKLCAHSYCSAPRHSTIYLFLSKGPYTELPSRSGCMEPWSTLSAGHMRQGTAQDLRKQTALWGYATPEGTKSFSIFYPASSLHAVAETHFRYDPSLGDMEAPGAITLPPACAKVAVSRVRVKDISFTYRDFIQ